MRPPPPGRLVDVGGFRLHINCTGEGTPAVVMDAALGGSSLSWALVQPELAKLTRVCSYDRAGFGWSDPGPVPRTVARIAGELRTLLERAAIPPPYVLVGHSFGGLVMRYYAAKHRDDAAALVLVDSAHPEDWVNPAPKEQVKIDRGVRLCRHGVRAARLGIASVVASLARAGAIQSARAMVRMASRGDLLREDEGIFAPVWKLPPEARQPLWHIWTQPKFYEALGSQIESICESAAQVLEASAGGYGDLPLVTMSMTNPGAYRLKQQESLARLSTRGRHVIASNSGHWILLDQPRLVIDEIEGVVTSLRRSST